MKLLIGGSSCTHWSIARTSGRETVPAGQGWELFLNYKIVLEKYQPDYFLYENNKSMAAPIREQITKELGVEPVCINSALVCAQNRNRLYWAGKRRGGKYEKVEIEQPADRGILLRDILETGACLTEKAYVLKASYGKSGLVSFVSGDHFPATGVAEPVRVGTIENSAKNKGHDSRQYRVYSAEGKSVTLCGRGGGLGAKTGLYAAPCSATGCSGPVYQVKDGVIEAGGRQYPVRLDDGYYTFRKLTVLECKRLQTVPDGYAFPVSNA